MPAEIVLVKVGMTMTEGMVEEWYVPDGGNVEKGQPLYRLETEKVNLDVDAETRGTVKHGVAVGVNLKPGDVIGWIYGPGEAIPTDTGVASSSTNAEAPGVETVARLPPMRHGEGDRVLASPAARRLAKELGVDYTAVAGTGPSGRIVEADIRLHAAATRGASAAQRPVRASPLAKRLAATHGVDLSRVAGTGPGGRITRADVEAAATAPTATTAARPATAPVPAAAGSVPLKGKRRTIAARMQQSLQQSAQLTMDMDVVMDDAVNLRRQLIAEWEPESIRPSFTDIVVRAVAKALRAHPMMNSVYGDTEITLLPEVHIGIAVAVDDGLVVPVLRDADARSLKDIATASSGLADAAREGRLGLDDMAGGTFTVSALGMYGVDSFTPILQAPQTGILGVNRIRDEVAWRGERPVPEKRMRLSLTWDHRVLDGAPAAQFLGTVRDLLESPYRLLV